MGNTWKMSDNPVIEFSMRCNLLNSVSDANKELQ